MKYLLLLALINLFSIFGVLNAQTPSSIPRTSIDSSYSGPVQYAPIQKKASDTGMERIISNGYFSWKVTGITDIDNVNMQDASEKFKINHPDVYIQISQDQPKIMNITFEDFNTMSKEKQQYILNNPYLFKLEQK